MPCCHMLSHHVQCLVDHVAVEVVSEVDVGSEVAVEVGQVCLHRMLLEEAFQYGSVAEATHKLSHREVRNSPDEGRPAPDPSRPERPPSPTPGPSNACDDEASIVEDQLDIDVLATTVTTVFSRPGPISQMDS